MVPKICKSVVFPAPDDPTIDTILPFICNQLLWVHVVYRSIYVYFDSIILFLVFTKKQSKDYELKSLIFSLTNDKL
jgi:hypothetical protein